MKAQKDTHNVIIIGSGPAALTAAIYTGRAQLHPLLIQGEKPGGQLMGTSIVENWPGEISILGPELMSSMMKQAKQQGAIFVSGSATKVESTDTGYIVSTNSDTQYQCRTILVATGASPRRLKCPGEDEYWGKGVTTCAVCDGALYKNKKVIVIGGGDSGAQDALFLTKFTKDITLVQNKPALTASKVNTERVLAHPQIKVLYDSTVTAFSGNKQRVTTAVIKNTKTGKTDEVSIDGAFLAIGLIPNSTFIGDFIATDKQGYITVNEQLQTSMSGIFAAGDIHDNRYRQAITAAGDGCKAALEIEWYLADKSNNR